MYSQGKRSARILGLVNETTTQAENGNISHREVLSPKKMTNNLPTLGKSKKGKNGLRMDLDEMLQMAKTHKNKPKLDKIEQGFGYLGKRSVVQFNLLGSNNNENENLWEEKNVTIDTTSVNSRKINSPIKRISHKKAKYNKWKSPAVIGRFADDTSSQTQQRVKTMQFSGLNLNSSMNGDAEVIDVMSQSNEASTKLDKRIESINLEAISVTSQQQQFEKTFKNRQDKLKDIERRFKELQDKIKSRDGSRKDPGKFSCISKINTHQMEEEPKFVQRIDLHKEGKKTVQSFRTGGKDRYLLER